MVNSNPETVSTDYDTSDRLYFEPLDPAAVRAVCRREQPVGVVIQFGGQTPLKLAASLEEAGIPILGTPFGAIDLAEDRERFGRLTDESLCYVAAVMQHVEEAGVHSGDSSCVLPAPSLDHAAYFEICHVVRRLARGLGVVGLLNVQLALAGGELFVLEANPRASRTVPFASKATGINLVEAACRLSVGVRIADLELPPERPPAQVSVKAAGLPF